MAILPYPVDAPGYIVFPGTAGNYLSVPDNAAFQMTGNQTIIVDFMPTAVGSPSIQVLGGRMNVTPAYQIYMQGTSLEYSFYDTGAVNRPFNSGAIPLVNDTRYRIAVTRVINGANSEIRFFTSTDDTTWTPIGTMQSVAFLPRAGASPLMLGTQTPTTFPYTGRMYKFSIATGTGAAGVPGGTEVFRFDATTDLAGLPPSMVTVPPDPPATFVPSVPTTALATINTQSFAAGQGYVTFPGTLGNYLSVADAVSLDILGALTVVWRERARDLTPTRLGQSVLSRAATTNNFSYRITHGPRDFVFGRSAAGVTPINVHVGSTEVPFLKAHNEQWIWWCLTFDTVPTNAVTRLWWCEDDSLTPPAASRWLPVATGAVNPVTDAGVKTIFNGSSPLFIGAATATDPSLNGDIGYLSLRTGGTTAVLGGTEVWRMDANNLVGLAPNASSITAAVGGAATVARVATPKDTGFIELPGTPGNYLSMLAAVGDLFTDTFSFYARVARDNWRPADPEAIVAKWGNIGQRSYLWRLEPDGSMRFYWSTTGTDVWGVGSGSNVITDPGRGVPLYIGMSTSRSGTDRTINFWTSPDAKTWTTLRATPLVVTQTTATAIFPSSTPLTFGSAAQIKSVVNDLHSFDGRILEVAGVDGIDGFFGAYTDTVERFRIGPEHLQISPTVTSFPAIGGTVSVIKTPYPNDFGVWRFPGTRYTRAAAPTAGNYLQVPDAVNLRITDNLCIEARIAPDDWSPQDTDRVLVSKMGASGNYGWAFMLTPRGTLKLLYSANGTVLNDVESTLPVTTGVVPPIADHYAKRVAVTYIASDRVRFWTSDNGITWTKLGVDVFGSGVLFATTAPVQIGVGYPGAMTSASIRNRTGTSGEPILDSEVLLIDQGCLNINAHPATFPAVTGQTVTVSTADFSLDNATQGWIDLPGTLGNYLDTPDVPLLDILGSMTIIIRFAPNDWTRTGRTQTLLAKWSATAGNFAWLLQLQPNGTFRFTWSGDGTTTAFLDSGQMASAIDGEFRMFAFTIEMGTTKTLRRWESLDFGNSWVIRDTASTAFGSATIANSNALLTIGAQNNTEHFQGRISKVDIRDGVGPGGAPISVTLPAGGSSRRLWWSPESLHIAPLPALPTVATFVEETGKTITIRRANTPSAPGNLNFYGREGDYASAVVPTLVSTTGMTLVARIDLSDTRPATDYLVSGAASTTQTPRPNIVGDVFISSYVTIVAGSTDQVLAGAWWTQTETSWRMYIDGFTGGLRFAWTTDGINPVWQSPPDIVTATELGGLGTGLVFLGLQIQRNASGSSLFTAMKSTDQGATWIPFGTPRIGPLMGDTWPSDPLMIDTRWDVRLTVGGAQIADLTTVAVDQAVTDASWQGRIQWVQMTQYPSDTLLWRFDPNEWPGTGLTFTDPRSRAWRLDAETAITQIDPPEVTTDQIIAQRWDEVDDCSFSLRRTAGGFTFSFSQDGTPTSGGEVGIPIDPDEWHSSELGGNWGWLAITLRVSGADSLVRNFIAPDTGTGTVPTTWTEIDTQVTAPGVGAMFVDATEPVTIGGAQDGDLPFIGRVSHLSLRDGTGTSGVVGGTERFRIDMASLYGVAPGVNSFPAGTGQTVSMLPATAARLANISPTPDGLPCLLHASPPGPTLYLDPAPAGPTAVISPSTSGPMTVITPSPASPTTALVSPSLDRGWWPGQTIDNVDDPTKWWTQPAFTVQRLLNGPDTATGGDYVRGSANVTTQQTALRFPTSLIEGLSPEGLGKGIIFTTPHPDAPYDTVLIEWNFPSDLTAKGHTDSINHIALDPWLQVAIVRSAFGAPTTVNDGQTVFLSTKSALFPGGTYVLDGDDNILTPDVYDARDPNRAVDPKLPGGRWYYYSLFFMIGKYWYKAASDQVLLPRNHHHADRLWEALPPYYRWADEQQAAGEPGHLQKFLTILGYDYDLTREYIESWQNMYQTDFTPMALLRRIGETFGIPYEQTIGDIRYRALIAKIGFLYIGRGTTGTLRRYVAAASKCDCDVVTSPNIMLLPDDSDFFSGTGNWAGLHRGTGISGSGIPAAGVRLTPDKIRLDYGTRNRPSVPEAAGRGSMHVWSSKTDATAPFIITCGDGERYAYDTGPVSDTDRTNDKLIPPGQPDSLIPRFHGIHVHPDQVVAFSFNACADPEAVTTVVQALLMFFDKAGQPSSLLSFDITGQPVILSLAIDTATGQPKWYEVVTDAPVPANAVYCVPAIIVTARVAGTHPSLSPMVHFAGAQFIVQGTTATVSGTDPAVQMLTLDYTGETIGGPQASYIDSKLGDER